MDQCISPKCIYKTIPWPITLQHRHLWYNMYYETNTLWCHQMETFATLLSLCAGNPGVTRGCPPQRDCNADLWYFFVVNKTVENTPLNCNSRRHDIHLTSPYWRSHSTIIIMTTCNATSDDKVGIMTTFSFKCLYLILFYFFPSFIYHNTIY